MPCGPASSSPRSTPRAAIPAGPSASAPPRRSAGPATRRKSRGRFSGSRPTKRRTSAGRSSTSLVAGKAFALLGPTASGKSRLAMALAERLPLEIVSMDSAQVYRGMDIGTAKPGAAVRARVPHHLLDVLDPDRSYSTGRWRSDAIAAVREVLARGKTPLIVGGTMLYYRALIGGLDALPQADPQVRAAIDAEAAERGWPALRAELERLDPR